MTTAVARTNGNGLAADALERVIVGGDLGTLTPAQRNDYYLAVCKSVGLNPLTKPFEYIKLNNRLVLYALRNCTDQLRSVHKISVVDMTEAEREGVCIVTCKVQNAEGRTDMAKGAVNVASLKGEALANAIMKAETKAKRRATLSICGLSLLDETEVEDIPRRDNPHVNRPEDIVDVPAADDPDRIHLVMGEDGRRHAIAELPRMEQRPIADKLGKELAAFTRLEDLERWKNLPETGHRLWTIRPEWREIFQGKLKEKLMELRGAQKMAEKRRVPLVREGFDADKPLDIDEMHRRLEVPPPEPEADWLDTINDAYSKCETAADAFDVDKKLFLPFIGSVSPDDRDRAQALRKEHLDRIEGAQQ